MTENLTETIARLEYLRAALREPDRSSAEPLELLVEYRRGLDKIAPQLFAAAKDVERLERERDALRSVYRAAKEVESYLWRELCRTETGFYETFLPEADLKRFTAVLDEVDSFDPRLTDKTPAASASVGELVRQPLTTPNDVEESQL